MKKAFLLTLTVVLLSSCAMFQAAKTSCPNLTGLPLTACETQSIVSQIEAQQPAAFAALDAIKAQTTPDIAARIIAIEATWPTLKASMDSLVIALNAGASGDVSKTVADAVSFYVSLSALVVQVGGKALPGLPQTVTVNALK
jgi:hypothetical protein